MGCMKGFEESKNRELGYCQKIVRVELQKSMVELCLLRVTNHRIGAVLERRSIARVWTGRPAFDVRISKFEVEQCLDA